MWFFGRFRGEKAAHESSPVMTWPLFVLASGAVLLGFFGTPIWPWFQDYLSGVTSGFEIGRFFRLETIGIMLASTAIVSGGLFAGWWFYSSPAFDPRVDKDPLEQLQPTVYRWLGGKLFFDEFYAWTVIRWNQLFSRFSDWLDRVVLDGAVRTVALVAVSFSWANRFIDEYFVNWGFDQVCRRVRQSAGGLSLLQNGQIHPYLRVIGVTLVVLVVLMVWGWQS